MNWTDDDRDESPTVLRYHPGQRLFNRYVLDHDLAAGGMGVVWLAYDELLDRRIALKFLPDRIRHDPASFDHLKHEAQKSIELSHPNIVRIYDFVHDEQTAAISMEYVDGDTLSSLRKAQPSKVFDVADIRAKMRQLCSALEYAHEIAEIVHRDLKPSNLMVNRRGQLKVTDFGIASSLQVGTSGGAGERGGGTPGYMSPQQAARQPASVADDIYSLGATIYDLLTSRPPYYSEEKKQVVAHMAGIPLVSMTERRAALRISGERIPRLWEDVVGACLEHDPAKRPQSVREVAERLGLLESTTRPVPQAPEMPSGVKIRVGDRRIIVSWNEVSGVTAYNVKRATQREGPYSLVGTVYEPAFADGTVQNERAYFYVVEATNPAGTSEPSAPVRGEPQPPPPPPGNFRAKVADRLVSLEWNASPDATAYVIKRSTKPGGPYTTIATVAASSRFQDAGVDNGTPYFYVVEAVSAIGLSAASVEIRAMPCPPPRAPVGVMLSVGDGRAEVKWKPVPDAVAYHVLRSEQPGGPYAAIATLEEATSYRDTGVKNGQTYFYVVESLNAAGLSPHSAEVSGTPQPVPHAPRGLRVEMNEGQVLLMWAGSSHATGYTVHRSAVPGGPYESVATVNTGTSFLDAPPDPKRTCYYVVHAFNASGASEASREIATRPAGKLRGLSPAPLLKWAAVVTAVAGLVWGGVWLSRQSFTVRQGIKVQTDPPGATLLVNGETIGTTPVARELLPGKYRLQVLLDGYETEDYEVEVTSQAVKPLTLPLNRSKGFLRIAGDPPGAYEYLVRAKDGSIVRSGTTDPGGALLAVETGRYAVEVKRPGWEPHLQQVEISRQQTNTVAAGFSPVTVHVTSDPSLAEVYRGLERLGQTPLWLQLPPGEHELEARFAGLAERKAAVTLRRGETNRVDFQFDYGGLIIRSEPPGAQVLAKDTARVLGFTPYTNRFHAAGPAGFLLQMNGHEARTLDVTVRRGGIEQVSVSLSKAVTPRGGLYVECEPRDATVLVDGVPSGQCFTQIPGLAPGVRTVRIEREGFEPVELSNVRIRPDEVENLLGHKLAPSRGTLEVQTAPEGLRFTVRDAFSRIVTNGAGSQRFTLTTGVYRVETTRSFWEVTTNDVQEVRVERNKTSNIHAVIRVGAVEVTSDPPDVAIWWSGRVRATNTPVVLELPGGRQLLEARHPWLGAQTLELVDAPRAEFVFDYGSVRVTSSPTGAEVFQRNIDGQWLRVGVTPFLTNLVPAGAVRYKVAREGYKAQEVSGAVERRSRKPLELQAVLPQLLGHLFVQTEPPGAEALFDGTVKITEWPRRDIPVGKHTLTLSLANHETVVTNVLIREDATERLSITLPRSRGAVHVDSLPRGASYVLHGPELRAPRRGTTPKLEPDLPTGDYSLEVTKGPWKAGPVKVAVARNQTTPIDPPLKLPYGRVHIMTTPAGAVVATNGHWLATGKTNTPVTLEEAPEGELTVAVRLKGYKPSTVTTNVPRQGEVLLNFILQPAIGPQPNEPWTNSLGMIFVPLGRHHICVTETRRGDYEKFVNSARYRESDKWEKPGFPQTGSHPVVNVNWKDAQEFCRWLTEMERRSSQPPFRLDAQFYRLPTESEWEAAAAIGRSMMFVWGADWPPPLNAGNFHNSLSFDRYDGTAPVGLFAPNQLGLFDISGNVWEWCGAESGGKVSAVARGGSWFESAPRLLMAAYRDARPADERAWNVGFRCVIDNGEGK